MTFQPREPGVPSGDNGICMTAENAAIFASSNLAGAFGDEIFERSPYSPNLWCKFPPQGSRQAATDGADFAAVPTDGWKRQTPELYTRSGRRLDQATAREQIAMLLRAIDDLHELCLLYVVIFCGTQKRKVMGMQWKSIPVPKLARPVIENWRRQCADLSPDALMFSTFGRGERKGQAVPRLGKNFLTGRIRPIARKLGMADRLITFQVMRRTLGTDMQNFGSLKDIQSMLRHGGSVTTNGIYVQPIDESVQQAADLRTAAVLNGWKAPVQSMGVGGRNVKGISAIRRSSVKPGKLRF